MNAVSALTIGVAVAVGIAALAAAAGRLRNRLRLKRRLERFATLEERTDAEVARVLPPTLSGAGETEKRPLVMHLERLYPLAGGVRTVGMALAAGVLALLALVPALAFVGVAPGFAVAGGLALAAGLGWNVGRFLENQQRLRFSDRFLLSVETFQRMTRYGMATAEAFRAIAESAEQPVSDSLRRVALDADFGVPLATALEREAKRVRIGELAMMAAIFSTQSRTGGGLSESIGNLAGMLRERIDSRAKIKASTSEPKISLIILSGVPFAAIAIQFSSQPEIVSTLLGDARHLLGIGAGLIAAGLTVAYFLVRSAQQ